MAAALPLASCAGEAAGPDGPAPATAARECSLYLPPSETLGETVQCGSVEVPWDRSAGTGEAAQLAFVKLRATGENPRPDPIVHVSGGPGLGATLREAVAELRLRYADLRRDRDVILYDQRGMGNSTPTFTCPDPRGDDARRIRQELVAGGVDEPDRREVAAAYCEERTEADGYPASAVSTATSAEDLRDVMNALGYDSYNLYGISYGTRLLMTLLGSRPQDPMVRSVVLDSVYPLPQDEVNDLNATSVREYPSLLAGLLDQCAADPRCGQAYPNLAQRYEALVDGLDEAPVVTSGGDTIDGTAFQASTYPQEPAIGHVPYLPRMVEELEGGTTTTFESLAGGGVPESDHIEAVPEDDRSRRMVDAFFQCELAGDAQADEAAAERRLLALWDAPADEIVEFLEQTCSGGTAAAAAELVRELPTGAFNAVIVRLAPDPVQGLNADLNSRLLCTEQYPFAQPPREVADDLTDADLPADLVRRTVSRITEQQQGCEGWTSRLSEPTEVPGTDTPVLILTGSYDTLTPPANAQLALDALPQAGLVEVPTATHSILGNYGSCVAGITADFLTDPGRDTGTSCTQSMRIDWILPSDPLPAQP